MRQTITVLFIDDETNFATNYLDALTEFGYEVIHRDSADGGLAYLHNHAVEIDLVVLDIQMPTPIGVTSVATNDGLDTGIWLLGEARDLLEESTLPVLVLSNRAKVALEGLIAEKVMLLNQRLVRVTTKTVTSAKKLPPMVQSILAEFGK
jgi:CheY-like chemotaxis protein